MRNRVLISWIGGNDLKVLEGGEIKKGPLLSTLKSVDFDKAVLLYNYPKDQVLPYLSLLKQQTKTLLDAHAVDLSSPVHFGEIYEAVSVHLQNIQDAGDQISILLNPGTPAMQAVWILLGKTRFPALFYQSTLEQGVQLEELPFEIAAEYVPLASKLNSNQLSKLAKVEAPLDAAFDDIITQNPVMLRLKQQAQILAKRNIPVLIYGETGTGKELFAKAIHNTSPRKDGPLVVLNCGAIAPDLIDSELFGHVKGAFTGAISNRQGVFEQADGGTLFLDEFGELEPAVQVRLLRVLQDGSFIPVGTTVQKVVNIRLIAATNRDLSNEVAEGRFREDLFYRIAVGVLHLPPLRQREGDLQLLADNLLSALAEQDEALLGKKLSVDAKNIIISQSWKGNVRELRATLLRASLWSEGDELTAADIRQALFSREPSTSDETMLDISQGIDIHDVLTDAKVRYVKKALELSHGHKARAAELLGLKSHQVLSNWMKKYGIN